MSISQSRITIHTAAGMLLLANVELFSEAPIKVSFMSAFTENAALNSDVNLEVFREELEKSHDVTGHWIQGEMGTSKPLQGLTALPTSKVLVVCTRRVTVPAAQLDTIKNYVNSGGAIVALRSQIHGFQNWYEFGKLLGGEYLDGSGKPLETYSLWGSATQAVTVKSGAAGHPVLEGFIPYSSSSTLPRNLTLTSEVTVLLEGTVLGDDKKTHTEPVAWVRELPSGQRIFYTSLEHKNDWSNTGYMKMMVNAVNWVSRRTGTTGNIASWPSIREVHPAAAGPRFKLVFEKGRIRLLEGREMDGKAALNPLGRWETAATLSR